MKCFLRAAGHFVARLDAGQTFRKAESGDVFIKTTEILSDPHKCSAVRLGDGQRYEFNGDCLVIPVEPEIGEVAFVEILK